MKKLLFLALLPLAFTAPAKADPAGCQVYAAQPATIFSAGDSPVIPCDRNGAPWVNSVGAGGGGTSSNFGAAFPAAGTAGGFSDGGNMQGARVFDLDSGAGTQYGLGVDLRFIANGGSVEAGTATNPLRTDPTGSTIQPVSGTVTIGAGAAVIGHVITDTGSTTAVTGTVAVTQSTSPWVANITQFGSNNVATGTGAGGVGIPRVTISNDSSLAANQSVNTAQFGGTNVSTGVGASGAGIPRVTVANDSNILASQSGTWTARIVGNAGATLDSTVGAGTAPTNQVVTGCLYNSTEISPTTGQAFADQCDSKGRSRGVIMDAAGNTRGANVDVNSNLGVVLPAETTKVIGTVRVQGNVGGVFDQATGSAVPANALYMGISDAGTIRGVLQAANSLNSTGTGIPTAQTVAQCDDTSPTALTENQFGNARMDCATHAQIVTSVPSATAGGTTLFTLTLAASTNATNVKASAGQVYSISGFNMSSATPVWISLYNNSGTPTCGTAIIQQFLIPGSTTGTGFVYDFATPKGFATGIAFCATTGIAGTGNPAASTYVLNIDYK